MTSATSNSSSSSHQDSNFNPPRSKRRSLPAGFSLVKSDFVPDAEGQVHLIRHNKTGAEILKIDNADEHRVFVVGFRTPITASDGRAHILEHTVLGGSQNFQLKDPFFELIKSSLYTFMNAYTMPDQTVYPIASVHPTDFMNLMRAYLDAVYKPNLERYTFMREGWHLKPNEAGTGFEYGGIVFNEMKGMYAQASYHLSKAMLAALFPNNSYGFDSGGNPSRIPDLTYEAFKKFHRDHYHPSNSLTVIYGAGDLHSELVLLGSYLNDFGPAPAAVLESGAPLVAEPRRVHASYPAQNVAPGQAFVSVGWGMPSSIAPISLDLQFVFHAIFGFRGAPLYERLEKRNLGRVLRGGYASYVKDSFFQITLEGTDAERASEIYTAIDEEIRRLAHEELSSDVLEAALHAFEFNLREHSNDAERGTNVVLELISPWLYGADPYEELMLEERLREVRVNVAQKPEVIRALLQKYLIENQHRVEVIVTPNAGLQTRWDAAEEARLRSEEGKMDAAARGQVLADVAELERRAAEPESQENIRALPRIHSSEVSRKPLIQRIAPIADERIFTADLDPHGIVYTMLSFSIDDYPRELLPYAALATRLLFGCDTNKRSFADLSTQLNRLTGGVSTRVQVLMHRTEKRLMKRFIVEGRALNRNLDAMISLTREVLTSAHLNDKARITKLIREYVKRDEQSIVPSGSRYAASWCARSLAELHAIDDEMYGVSATFQLREIAAQLDTQFDAVAQKIRLAFDLLLSRNFEGLVVADRDVRESAAAKLSLFGSELAARAVTRGTDSVKIASTPPRFTKPQGLSVPSQVNYVARAIDGAKAGIPDHGANRVFRQLVWGNYLLDHVRFQGGAYGVSAGFNASTNVFSCSSFRDPELAQTIEVFRALPAWVAQQEFSPDDIDRGVIAVIRDHDAPESVYGKAHSAFVERDIGYTPDLQQELRTQVLDTTAQQVKQLGEQLHVAADSEQICIVGGADALNEYGCEVRALVE